MTEPTIPHRPSTLATSMFAFMACAFLLLNSRAAPYADGKATYLTTIALVEKHTLAIDKPINYEVVRDSKRYAIAPLGNVIAQIPSYLLFCALSLIRLLPHNSLYAMCSHFSPSLLQAGAAMLLFQLLCAHGISRRRAVFYVFIFSFCTLSFIQARLNWCEALQTFALTWVTERTLVAAREPSRKNLAWLGVAAGVLLQSKLVYCLVLPFYGGYLLWNLRDQLRPRLPALLYGLVTFSLFVLLALWHNEIKTGNVFDAGYRNNGGNFSGHFWVGLYGLTLSPGKGLFWYSPPLLLLPFGLRGAYRRWPQLTLLLGAVLLTAICFNAKFRFWHGDWAWGPRYMGPLTPLLFFLTVPAFEAILNRGVRSWRGAVLAVVITLGIGVNVIGATFYWDHYIRVLAVTNPFVTDTSLRSPPQPRDQPYVPTDLEQGYFIPAFSPIVGQGWFFWNLLRNTPARLTEAPFVRHLTAVPVVEPFVPGLSVDWWGLDFVTGAGTAASVFFWIVATLLVAAIYVCGIRLYTQSKNDYMRFR